MESLFASGRMAPHIQVNGNLVRKTVKVRFNSQMDPYTKGSSRTISLMVRVLKFSLMDLPTLDNSSSACSMARVNLNKLMISLNMKDIGDKTK